LTYSLTLPNDHPLIVRGANRLYELAHDAIITCLSSVEIGANRCGTTDDSGAARGPFFCFERRHCYDLLIGQDKIAGSAQRRTRKAVLQHGSIILANRFPQQPSAFAGGAEGFKAISDLPAPPEWFPSRLESVRAALPDHFARVLRFSVGRSDWTDAELVLSDAFKDKHQGDEWICRT